MVTAHEVNSTHITIFVHKDNVRREMTGRQIGGTNNDLAKSFKLILQPLHYFA